MRNDTRPGASGGASGHLAVTGARLFYRVDGPPEAPAILFSNSLGADLRMWEPQAQSLAARFRVIRYDTRGHGRSDAPPGPYTLDQLSGDALALLDALDIARAHVCGLSLGGMVALSLAASHPDRVRRAVFANTAARIGSAASWTERIAAVQAGGMDGIHDAILARFLLESVRQSRPQTARAVSEMLLSTPPAGYISACAALRDADLRGAVGQITAPALIIVGERDQSTPPAQARALHEAIAGSQLVILDNASHLSNLEQPEAFTAHLLAFLDQP